MEENLRRARNENENHKNTIRMMEAEHSRTIKTFEEKYLKVKIEITNLINENSLMKASEDVLEYFSDDQKDEETKALKERSQFQNQKIFI